MYQNNPQGDTSLHVDGEKIASENYFVIDWVSSDPMKRGRGIPIIAVGNATPEQLQLIADGKIRVENPRSGTKQRVICKVVAIQEISNI